MKSTKIAEQVFRGIHFIRLSDLPEDQATGLKESLEYEQQIKIMINNEIIPDCVQYHHYEEWFENKYLPQLNEKEEQKPTQTTENNGSAIPNLLRPSY